MIDMLSLLPEYTVDQFDSRHRLVLVAAQRAKHLIQGAKVVGPSKFTKETTVALDDALKESKRVKEGETERVAMMTGEDAKEIKKELSVYVDDTPKAPPAEGEET
jgi:DNA-directed RNA polymerase subunit omega